MLNNLLELYLFMVPVIVVLCLGGAIGDYLDGRRMRKLGKEYLDEVELEELEARADWYVNSREAGGN